jgi:quercetin dioxygenase-like cupin family protein
MFYSVVNSETGVAGVTTRQPLQPVAMPVDGWSITSLVTGGMDISIYRVAPNALYSSHAAPFECVCIVAEGTGELFLTDAGGRELDVISCRKGDAYLQGANTLHGFRNGPQETMLIYLRPV